MFTIFTDVQVFDDVQVVMMFKCLYLQFFFAAPKWEKQLLWV